MTNPDSERRFEIAAHAASLGVWEWDLLTNGFVYSDRAKEICGFAPDAELSFEDIVAVTHPDDLPWTSAQAGRALDPEIRSREPYRYRIRRADTAEVRWVLAHGQATFEEVSGTPTATKYIGTLQDITDQKIAEDALFESEARLRLAIEAAGLAVWELDIQRDILSPSPELNALYGFSRDEHPSTDAFRGRYAPGEQQRLEQLGAEAAARGETQLRTEVKHIWPDGTVKWLLVQAQAAAPIGGGGPRAIGIVMDVTERRLAQERLVTLTHELQHRVKNLLSIVQVMATRTFRDETPVPIARAAFIARIQALAASTEVIARQDGPGADVADIIDVTTRPYRDQAADPFVLDGPSTPLVSKAATGLAMALHELCTNAAKYGGLSTPQGRVRISWAVEDGWLELKWQESGGPPVEAPSREGFGTRLLSRGIFDAADGTVELAFEPAGAVCRIRCRLSDRSPSP